jgi:hypothetical protein
VTVQTTVNAITQSPSLTATFLTVNQEPLLPNSRYFSAINGIQITDGGAQNPFTVSIVANPTIPGNAGMAIPSGTTAQRNTTPAAIRFNSQTVAFEGFDGTNWVSFITNVAPSLITFSAGTTGLTPNTPTGGNIVLAGTLEVANGGTGLTSITANRIPYGNGTSALQTSANLTFDGTTLTNTGNAVIVDNSANAALRITQTGAGNALLVEDSSNPDATPFVVAADGSVGVGTATPSNKLSVVGGRTNLTANNETFSLGVQYATGVGLYYIGATNSVTPDLVFSQVGGLERMRLTNDGSLGLGVTPSSSALLEVSSTTKGVRMPNMTTTQKNAIASPAAGLMVFDTTLSKLSVYTGAAWQTITSV